MPALLFRARAILLIFICIYMGGEDGAVRSRTRCIRPLWANGGVAITVSAPCLFFSFGGNAGVEPATVEVIASSIAEPSFPIYNGGDFHAAASGDAVMPTEPP